MSKSQSRAPFWIFNSVDDIASIAVIIAAYLATWLIAPESYTLPQGLWFIGAGLVLLALGIYGLPFCEARYWRFSTVIYFAIQIPLSLIVLYLSNSQAWLVLLPLISQATLIDRKWMVIVTPIMLAGFVFVLGILTTWDQSFKTSILFVPAVVFVIIFTEITKREQHIRAQVEQLASELNDANIKLREYATQVEELATTKERNRLAREIHDGLGHYLTAINMQIQAARAVMDTDRAQASDALGKAQALTKEGLTEVRRSVAALRASPMENRPLREAIAKLIDECRASGITAELIVAGASHPLAPQIDLALYRAAEESLTNVRKHAQASRVDLLIDYSTNNCVRMSIKDNGVGSSDPNGGFGLLGIRERVQLLGGTVQIETAQDKGFSLQIEVPL